MTNEVTHTVLDSGLVLEIPFPHEHIDTQTFADAVRTLIGLTDRKNLTDRDIRNIVEGALRHYRTGE